MKYPCRIRRDNLFIPNSVALRVMSEAFGRPFENVEEIGEFFDATPGAREWLNRSKPGERYLSNQSSTLVAQEEKTDEPI